MYLSSSVVCFQFFVSYFAAYVFRRIHYVESGKNIHSLNLRNHSLCLQSITLLLIFCYNSLLMRWCTSYIVTWSFLCRSGAIEFLTVLPTLRQKKPRSDSHNIQNDFSQSRYLSHLHPFTPTRLLYLPTLTYIVLFGSYEKWGHRSEKGFCPASHYSVTSDIWLHPGTLTLIRVTSTLSPSISSFF